MTKKVYEIRQENQTIDYQVATTIQEIEKPLGEGVSVRELNIFDRDRRYIDHGYYSQFGNRVQKEQHRKLLESLKLAIKELHRK